MWPCWFILLFISCVPSARRFYFFIRSVRAIGTTQSLLFISFTKPRMNQHGHIKCCKWVPWQHLDGSWFALYFHRQRNIKFSFRRHILYNKINLLVVQKAWPIRTKFQVFVPNSRKQYSRNGSHGNTLPEVNFKNKKTAAELREESIKKKNIN
jgi:hypothetical protein